jgi:hypothetical protein
VTWTRLRPIGAWRLVSIPLNIPRRSCTPHESAAGHSAGNEAKESPSQLGVAMAPFQLYHPFLGNENGHFAAVSSFRDAAKLQKIYDDR